MPLLATDRGGADFDPVPSGTHQAICIMVIDLGTQPQNNPTYRATRKVALVFELPHIDIIIKPKDQPERKEKRRISQIFTLSLSEKATLRPFLESWRGRAFTEAELKGFDIIKVLGVNCILNVVHEVKNGKTFANIKAAIPLIHPMVKLPPSVKPISFSIDDYPADFVIPQDIPDWLKAKIMQSEEYIKKNATGGQHEEPGTGGVVPEDAPPGEDTPF